MHIGNMPPVPSIKTFYVILAANIQLQNGIHSLDHSLSA